MICGGIFKMSKKVNEKFISAYAELDKSCCAKFGISSGGLTEYINRLGNARFAPKRDDVLPRLVKYRNLRNIFAHEAKELKKSDDITKADITWLGKFNKDVIKKKDPYSSYLKKARRYARGKKIRKYAICIGVLAVAVAAVILYFVFK